MKYTRLSIIVSCSIIIFVYFTSAFTQENDWLSIATEKQYFESLYAADASTFKCAFEYPLLLMLDKKSKEYYLGLNSLEKRKRYIKLYWDRSNPNPLLPANDYLVEFVNRCRIVKDNFSYPKPPYFDDRGKYHLKYGPPSGRFEDKGGVKTIDSRLYWDTIVQFELYGDFPPALYFSVYPNET